VSVKKDQIEDEILRLKEEIKALSEKGTRMMPEESSQSLSSVIKYFTDERERTNRALSNITGKVMELEKIIREKEEIVAPQEDIAYEIPMSSLDANILDFVKGKGMACADDVKTLMNYKGRNAACSRLKKLEKDGFLEKFQLGHKVYYRYYAGKTTKTLIISPPQ
jgi:hypothetical protein